VQLAEVGDVLARGQVVVDAGAVRQHADGAARGQRILGDAATIDVAIARSGLSTVYNMRSVVDLPAPFGTQQPGDLAVTRREAHAAHAGPRRRICTAAGFEHYSAQARERGEERHGGSLRVQLTSSPPAVPWR
jgi:hypothetical protein